MLCALPLLAACAADRLQHLIGEDATAIEALDLSVPLRVLHPGDVITREYRPDRLDIELDEAGRITRVWCV